MNIEETNRNLKLITIFINFVFRQLRFLPFPSSFITVGYRHFHQCWAFGRFREFLPILMFLDEHGLMKIAKRMKNAEHLREKKNKLINFKQNCWTICQNRAASPRNLRVSQANSHWEHLKRTWTAAIFVQNLMNIDETDKTCMNIQETWRTFMKINDCAQYEIKTI